MTRAQIREKHGISMLESPSVANKELSEKEVAEYENCVSRKYRKFLFQVQILQNRRVR